jgi:hypothetical protein
VALLIAAALGAASCGKPRGADTTAGAASTTAAPAPSPADPAAPRGNQLAILYSSNILGEYEPCG